MRWHSTFTKILQRLFGLYEIEYQVGGKDYGVTCVCGREQGEQLAALLSSLRHGVVIASGPVPKQDKGALKAFQIGDDLYAAASAAQATLLAIELTGECGEEPRELGDAELDERIQAFDEDELPIAGETTSVREMLDECGATPCWFASTDW